MKMYDYEKTKFSVDDLILFFAYVKRFAFKYKNI